MTPIEVTDLDMAFPAHVKNMMPDLKSPEVQSWGKAKENKQWFELQADWFYKGLTGDVHFEVKEGIDGKKAMRHLSCIQRSFEPKHEEKELAVAYLFSLWFKSVKWSGGEAP